MYDHSIQKNAKNKCSVPSTYANYVEFQNRAKGHQKSYISQKVIFLFSIYFNMSIRLVCYEHTLL